MQQRKQQHKSMPDMQLKLPDTTKNIIFYCACSNNVWVDALIVVIGRIFFSMIGGCVEEDDAHYLRS